MIQEIEDVVDGVLLPIVGIALIVFGLLAEGLVAGTLCYVAVHFIRKWW